jgi:3-oxoacyl-[acyl-carrier-protein] synthase-1
MGIVSSIGNNCREVAVALEQGRSGISASAEYQELGFRSQVHGSIDVDLTGLIDRKLKRFMGDAAAYNYLAMCEAVADSGLDDGQVSNPRTGLVVGSGSGSPANIVNAADLLRDQGRQACGPLHGHSQHGQHNRCLYRYGLQDQGCVVFHQFGLCDQRPLHRQCS